MQSVDHSGILGEVQEFNQKELERILKDEKVSHIDVFPGTKENIKTRSALVGKVFPFKMSKGFKKAPIKKKRNKKYY